MEIVGHDVPVCMLISGIDDDLVFSMALFDLSLYVKTNESFILLVIFLLALCRRRESKSSRSPGFDSIVLDCFSIS